MIAYWLLPELRALRTLSELIGEFAAKFDAPIFDPHVTIYVGGEEGNATGVVKAVCANEGPIMLMVAAVEHSEDFTKTLFVQFAPNARVQRLNRALREQSGAAEKYEVNPHLSLVYAHLSATVRAAQARRIDLPFAEIEFDRVRAVLCPTPIQTRADVENWQTITEARLEGAIKSS